MDYITATLEVVCFTKLPPIGSTHVRNSCDVIGCTCRGNIINGVIGQYVCKMNRCKLCDAPVLESRNRRQLASKTSQRCRAVLMDLAIETTKKKGNLGESMNQGTCVQCFESIKKYLALQDKLDSIRRDLKSAH